MGGDYEAAAPLSPTSETSGEAGGEWKEAAGEGEGGLPDVPDASSSSHESEAELKKKKPNNLGDTIRKTGVAITGSAMVGVGLVMIPLPTPFGAVIAGSGMAVLGTEFPAAQRVLREGSNKLADAIEKSVSRDEDDAPEEEKEEEDDDDYVKIDSSDAPPLPDESSSSSLNTAHANEKMKQLLSQSNKETSTSPKNQPLESIKGGVRQLGKKAVPIIRKIGDGIDAEQVTEATQKFANQAKQFSQNAGNKAKKAAADAGSSVSAGASSWWRAIMVLDKEEDVMTPFMSISPSPTSEVTDDDATPTDAAAPEVS